MGKDITEPPFKHSKTLFTVETPNKKTRKPMEFCMRSAPERRKIKGIIEHGGGRISNVATQGCISLAPEGSFVATADKISISYILQSVAANKLLDKDAFKLPVSEQASGPSVIDVDFDTVPAKGRKSVKKRFNEYSFKEDEAILMYIKKNSRINATKGNSLYKEMEQRKIVDRPWQSVKNRLGRNIVRQLGIYTAVPGPFKQSLADFFGVKYIEKASNRKNLQLDDQAGPSFRKVNRRSEPTQMDMLTKDDLSPVVQIDEYSPESLKKTSPSASATSKQRRYETRNVNRESSDGIVQTRTSTAQNSFKKISIDSDAMSSDTSTDRKTVTTLGASTRTSESGSPTISLNFFKKLSKINLVTEAKTPERRSLRNSGESSTNSAQSTPKKVKTVDPESPNNTSFKLPAELNTKRKRGRPPKVVVKRSDDRNVTEDDEYDGSSSSNSDNDEDKAHISNNIYTANKSYEKIGDDSPAVETRKKYLRSTSASSMVEDKVSSSQKSDCALSKRTDKEHWVSSTPVKSSSKNKKSEDDLPNDSSLSDFETNSCSPRKSGLAGKKKLAERQGNAPQLESSPRDVIKATMNLKSCEVVVKKGDYSALTSGNTTRISAGDKNKFSSSRKSPQAANKGFINLCPISQEESQSHKNTSGRYRSRTSNDSEENGDRSPSKRLKFSSKIQEKSNAKSRSVELKEKQIPMPSTNGQSKFNNSLAISFNVVESSDGENEFGKQSRILQFVESQNKTIVRNVHKRIVDSDSQSSETSRENGGARKKSTPTKEREPKRITRGTPEKSKSLLTPTKSSHFDLPRKQKLLSKQRDYKRILDGTSDSSSSHDNDVGQESDDGNVNTIVRKSYSLRKLDRNASSAQNGDSKITTAHRKRVFVVSSDDEDVEDNVVEEKEKECSLSDMSYCSPSTVVARRKRGRPPSGISSQSTNSSPSVSKILTQSLDMSNCSPSTIVARRKRGRPPSVISSQSTNSSPSVCKILTQSPEIQKQLKNMNECFVSLPSCSYSNATSGGAASGSKNKYNVKDHSKNSERIIVEEPSKEAVNDEQLNEEEILRLHATEEELVALEMYEIAELPSLPGCLVEIAELPSLPGRLVEIAELPSLPGRCYPDVHEELAAETPPIREPKEPRPQEQRNETLLGLPRTLAERAVESAIMNCRNNNGGENFSNSVVILQWLSDTLNMPIPALLRIFQRNEVEQVGDASTPEMF